MCKFSSFLLMLCTSYVCTSVNLCDTFGSKVVNVRTCQKWFAKFRSGDLTLKEDSRSGRPSKFYNDILRSMLESNSHLMSREVAKELGIHHSTAQEHITNLGFILKQNIWVLHNLTEENLSDRGKICSSLWTSITFGQAHTGNEKWILYKNI